jgi:hypothetical protein
MNPQRSITILIDLIIVEIGYTPSLQVELNYGSRLQKILDLGGPNKLINQLTN